MCPKEVGTYFSQICLSVEDKGIFQLFAIIFSVNSLQFFPAWFLTYATLIGVIVFYLATESAEPR